MSSSEHITPPKWPIWLLKRVVKPAYLEEIEGDMEEVFYDYLEGHTPSQASRHYIFETLKLLRPNLLRRISGTTQLNYYGMFKLLVKTSIRNYFKHRMVSTMSLIALIFGVVAFQLIYDWIRNEQSMDQFHSKADRIHLATARLNPNSEPTALHVQRIFGIDYAQFPQIENSLIIHTYGEDEIKLFRDETAYSGKALIADSTFFKVFDFALLQGEKSVLDDPSSIVLSKAFADRVFPNQDAMGKAVSIQCDQKGTYQVAAIVDEIPSNSSITFDFIVPRHSKGFWRRMPQDLLLMKENVDLRAFNEQIRFLGRESETSRFPESELSLVSLHDLYHNHPFHISLLSKYGDRTSYHTMQIVAGIIFFITLISFVNLQSTLQLTLVKKVGVKQVLGANKFDLGFEIVVSRMLYFIAAVALAFGLHQLVFSDFVNTLNLSLDNRPITDLRDISIVVGFIVLVSVVVSLVQVYRIKTMQAISGEAKVLKVPASLRVLTVLQYSVTILLLIATSVVFMQLKYMLNMDSGLNQTDILKTDFFEIMPNGAEDRVARQRMINQHAYVLSRMQQNPDIIAVSQGTMPIDIAYQNPWKIVDETDGYSSVSSMSVDPDYDDLFGVNLVEGRFFSDSLDTNNEPKVIINEAAKKYWGIDDITQVKLTTNTRSNITESYDIIGVVEDYHYEHLSQKIRPLVLTYYVNMDTDILVRFRPGKEQETASFLEELYQEVNPGGFFSYTTMESKVAKQYAKEQQMGTIYLTLSLVALLLSSIGLFTFAFHETKRRTKEIGIRKVNGAHAGNVFWLLSRSFLSTIVLAFILATPVAWFLMKEWLANFANHIHFSWWIFAGVGLVVTILALMAVSLQTVKLARLNPVESLRYE